MTVSLGQPNVADSDSTTFKVSDQYASSHTKRYAYTNLAIHEVHLLSLVETEDLQRLAVYDERSGYIFQCLRVALKIFHQNCIGAS